MAGRDTVLIGDATNEQGSHLARKTYFAEPVLPYFPVPVPQPAVTKYKVNLKGDKEWMTNGILENPLDDKEQKKYGISNAAAACPGCGAVYSSGNMAFHKGRLCGGCSARNRKGGGGYQLFKSSPGNDWAWRSMLHKEGGLKGMPMSPGPPLHTSQFTARNLSSRPRTSVQRLQELQGLVPSEPTPAIAPAVANWFYLQQFDSPEQRQRIGFKDRGKRRFKVHG